MTRRLPALLATITLLLSGCGADISTPYTGPYIYAGLQNGTTAGTTPYGYVKSYQSNVSGHAFAPAASSAVATGFTGDLMCGDGAGKIYVLSSSQASNNTAVLTVTQYTAVAGVLTATRSFIDSGGLSGGGIRGMAADRSGNVYLAEDISGDIDLFPPTASGVVPPNPVLRVAEPSGMALDAAGDLFVIFANGQSIDVFNAGFARFSAPSRTLTTSPNNDFTTLAIDASGNIYAVGFDSSVTTGSPYAVQEFPAGIAGFVFPFRRIEGPLTTLFDPYFIALDTSGNIYLQDAATPATSSSLGFYEFSATARGNVAPTRTFTVNTNSGDGFGLAVQ